MHVFVYVSVRVCVCVCLSRCVSVDVFIFLLRNACEKDNLRGCQFSSPRTEFFSKVRKVSTSGNTEICTGDLSIFENKLHLFTSFFKRSMNSLDCKYLLNLAKL